MSQPTRKRPRHEAPGLPTHSNEFPEGYGDFVFKSSDGVIFHFPRFFLSHVSPVFKDMFASSGTTQDQETPTLTKDYATLECFLRHIDPAKEAPQLDWERVTDVLQAAEKYQVNNIFKWSEREVELSFTSSQYPALPSRYPALPNPMLCLALARRYDLQTTAQLSLHRLERCPLSEITGSPHVDSTLLKRIIDMRATQTRVLTKFIYGTSYQHLTQ
ncbi:hypothetical protein CPB86DRAFT_876895 [Serendipita vermifera]|nr:hypothetical protein CPB86DRAFT_876895 [Serendipita vermifera]